VCQIIYAPSRNNEPGSLYACTRAPVAWARIVGVPNAYQTSWSDLARYFTPWRNRALRWRPSRELLRPPQFTAVLKAISYLHFHPYFCVSYTYKYYYDRGHFFKERSDFKSILFLWKYSYKLRLCVCGRILRQIITLFDIAIGAQSRSTIRLLFALLSGVIALFPSGFWNCGVAHTPRVIEVV